MLTRPLEGNSKAVGKRAGAIYEKRICQCQGPPSGLCSANSIPRPRLEGSTDRFKDQEDQGSGRRRPLTLHTAESPSSSRANAVSSVYMQCGCRTTGYNYVIDARGESRLPLRASQFPFECRSRVFLTVGVIVLLPLRGSVKPWPDASLDSAGRRCFRSRRHTDEQDVSQLGMGT
jgi:hypothetical protein